MKTPSQQNYNGGTKVLCISSEQLKAVGHAGFVALGSSAGHSFKSELEVRPLTWSASLSSHEGLSCLWNFSQRLSCSQEFASGDPHSLGFQITKVPIQKGSSYMGDQPGSALISQTSAMIG